MCEWKGTDLGSWEDFIRKVDWLRQKKEKSGCTNVLSLLFRGDSDPSRNLQTSLEREWTHPVALHEYFKLITKIRPEVESVTGARWNEVPDYPEYEKWICELHKPTRPHAPPGYEYLAYLRHHEFSSPFLDWSRSPYVAAYFAFARAKEDSQGCVSIYVYCEVSGNKAYGCSDKPIILSLGPYVRTHRRHFQQQSEYTMCIQNKNGAWKFVPHCAAIGYRDLDEHLDSHPNDKRPDLAWKFNIPVSEKWKVLKYLDEHNLNGFSLLGSEDELMKTLAMREVGRRHAEKVSSGETALD